MPVLFYVGFTSDNVLDNCHKSTRKAGSAFTGIETST